MSRAFAVAVVAMASGCGTSILLSYPLDEPFLRAHSDVEISRRPLEDPVLVAKARIDTSPLRIECDSTTLVARVEATRRESFDGPARMLTGFIALAEGTFAVAIASQGDSTAAQATAAALGADALVVLAYTIFSKSEYRVWTTVQPGLPERSHECPDGLAVHAAGQTWPVGRDGRFDGDVRALAQLAASGEQLSLAVGASEKAWKANEHDRCAIVAEYMLDDPNGTCHPAVLATATPTPAAAPAAPEAVGAGLEVQIRIHLPPGR